MPFKVTYTFRRPDEEVLWHSQHFRDKVSPQYSFIQKQFDLYNTRTYTLLDPLTAEIVTVWDSEEQFNEYINTPAVIFQQEMFDMYNQVKGITKEVTKTNI